MCGFLGSEEMSTDALVFHRNGTSDVSLIGDLVFKFVYTLCRLPLCNYDSKEKRSMMHAMFFSEHCYKTQMKYLLVLHKQMVQYTF